MSPAKTTNRQLALEYRIPATGYASWRKGEELIDALPYIDSISPQIKAQVDALIEEEKRNSTKTIADYLKEMPPMPSTSFAGHEALQKEYERVRTKQPMPALDVSRYQLNPPIPTKRNDPSAWQAALDNACSQLEHQQLRILNMEILLKHGDKVWRAQTQLDESLVKQFEQQLASTRKEIDAVNRERKLQQSAAGRELDKLEQQYHSLLQKNFAIDSACNKLETQVATLQARHQAIVAQQAQQAAQQDAALQQAQAQQATSTAGASQAGLGDAQQSFESDITLAAGIGHAQNGHAATAVAEAAQLEESPGEPAVEGPLMNGSAQNGNS